MNYLSRFAGALAILGLCGLLGLAVRITSAHPGLGWKWIVFLVRSRIGIFLILAPAILAVASLTLGKHLLYSLLIFRDGFGPYVADLVVVTALSLMTVTVGFASIRIVELYGNERFGTVNELFRVPGEVTQADSTATEATRTQVVWPRWKIIAWIVLGTIFPSVAAFICYREGLLGDASWITWVATTIGGLLAGLLVHVIFILVLALIQAVFFNESAGLLPIEFTSFPKLNLGNFLFGPQFPGLAWWSNGPGYVSPYPGGPLKPGHAQMAVAAITSLVTYFVWYYNGEFRADPTSYRWPTAFYALLLILSIGWFLSTFSFCLDRFGVPSSVAVLGWVILMNFLGQTDARFELKFRKQIQALPVAKQSNEAGDSLELALGNKHEAAHERQTPIEIFGNGKWKFPPNHDGQRTLVVVTASGGGIQASAWAAKVLTELDREFENFSQSVAVISCVSGGSLGSLMYLAGRPYRTEDGQQPLSLSELQRQTIWNNASGRYLEPVAWGVAFPDFVRNFFPPLAPTFNDRGWALESEMWNRMGTTKESRNRMESVYIGDLINPVIEAQIPAVIFNSTSVETGQRILISPINLEQSSKKYEGVDVPLDFLAHSRTVLTDQLANDEVLKKRLLQKPEYEGELDLKLSTAVRLSASFAYVAPVAKPALGLDDSYHDLKPDEHFCDGGYADNPGLLTAVKLTRELIEGFRKKGGEKPFDNILIVRIEPFPRSQRELKTESNGFAAQSFGPASAISNVRVSTQAERGQFELELFLQAEKYQQDQILKANPTVAGQLTDLVKKAEQTSETLGKTLQADGSVWSLPQDIMTKDSLGSKIGAIKDYFKNFDTKSNPLPDELQEIKTEFLKLKASTKEWLEVDQVVFQFTPTEDEKGSPPLSWNLPPSAAKEINESWEGILKDKKFAENNRVSFETMKRFFPTRSK